MSVTGKYAPNRAYVQLINPLRTDEAFWCRQSLTACYQLVQSILKIGFALAEKEGQEEVGGCTPLADSAW